MMNFSHYRNIENNYTVSDNLFVMSILTVYKQFTNCESQIFRLHIFFFCFLIIQKQVESQIVSTALDFKKSLEKTEII